MAYATIKALYAQQLAPRGMWLRDDTSQAYLGALGGAVGTTLDLWNDAVLVRFARHAPEDALPHVADARQLPIAPGEAAADYRERAQRSFEIHEDRTTDDAYRHALEPIGVDPAAVAVYNEYEVGEHDWYSEVFVFVDSTAGPWTLGAWDDGGVWDDGGLWDVDGLTGDELAFTRRMIRRWKWAAAYPARLMIWLSGTIWTPGGAVTWEPSAWHLAGDAIPVVLGHTWDEGEEYSGSPDLWDDGGSWDDQFPETE